jgi:hypothetical protein
MSKDDRYVVVKKDGIDTLHVNPREECNLDDTELDRELTEDEAEAALNIGTVRACGHCG